MAVRQSGAGLIDVKRAARVGYGGHGRAMTSTLRRRRSRSFFLSNFNVAV